MKRIQKLVNNIVEEIFKDLKLDGDMKKQIIDLLSYPISIEKQEMFNQLASMLSKTKLKAVEIEAFLKMTYEQYFLKYELIKSCAEEEDRREKGKDEEKVCKLNQKIEIPTPIKPLKEAKEIHSGKPIILDESYLD